MSSISESLDKLAEAIRSISPYANPRNDHIDIIFKAFIVAYSLLCTLPFIVGLAFCFGSFYY